jgi:hypothetical protein
LLPSKLFLQIQLFKVGKEYWVVAATKKEAPKYRALTQVKDELKPLIEKRKNYLNLAP